MQTHVQLFASPLQLSWCKEGGEHKQVPGARFWCKPRNYSSDFGKAASDLHQESSDQYVLLNIHFTTLKAAAFRAAAVECQ